MRDFQIVWLQSSEVRATCCVVATGGEAAVLEPRSAHEVRHLPLPGRVELVFETDRHPVMLSGVVDEGPLPGTLRFRVTDAVLVRQMRVQPRLVTPFDVLVTPLHEDGMPAGPQTSITTRDVSAGGAFLDGYAGAAGSRVAIRMAVPGMPRPFDCTGRVLRRTTRGAAVRFDGADPGMQAILDQLIFTLRRRMARRVFDDGARAA